MDIHIFSHMWAAGITTIGMALGFLVLSFALNAKKQFGGVVLAFLATKTIKKGVEFR